MHVPLHTPYDPGKEKIVRFVFHARERIELPPVDVEKKVSMYHLVANAFYKVLRHRLVGIALLVQTSVVFQPEADSYPLARPGSLRMTVCVTGFWAVHFEADMRRHTVVEEYSVQVVEDCYGDGWR